MEPVADELYPYHGLEDNNEDGEEANDSAKGMVEFSLEVRKTSTGNAQR